MKTHQLSQVGIGVTLCAFILLLFSGCIAWTNISGITPVYPKSGVMAEFSFGTTVDSLQPELKWKGGNEFKKYDLAIWNTIIVSGETQSRKIIYRKTGLSGTVHKVDIVLEPDTAYFWSVRETGSEAWSTVTLHAIAAGGTTYECHSFQFRTPTTAELEKKPKE